MKFLRFVLIVIVLIVAAACSSASNVIVPATPLNVQRYGEDAPEIWMPLNQIELDTLVKAKENFDDEAKLLLSIFLTSDFRDPEPVNACLNVYRKFIASCDKELEKISDPGNKAKKLHQLFFKEFIKNPRKKDAANSGMPGILLIKEYDVNTANLLFGIIAEKYGYSIEISFAEEEEIEFESKTGLIMKGFSGKSYLILKHENIYSDINVVPFLENGYDIYINLGFFDDLHKSHPVLFDSPEVELQRYYKKKDMSFQKAILLQYKTGKKNENIDSEHAPIHRKIEMAAYVTDYCEVLIDRLWVWRNLSPLLIKKEIPEELPAFVDTIRGELKRTDDLCGNERGFVEAAWDIYLFSSFEFANLANGEKMKEAVVQAYLYLSPALENYDKKKLFLTRAIYNYINQVVKQEKIIEELPYAKEIINAIPENEKRTEVASSFYSQAGEYYLKKKDLWSAGQFFADCAFLEHDRYKNSCTLKGVDALYKYAEESINKGVCPIAADARDKCLEKIPDKKECDKIEKIYNERCCRNN